MSIELREYLGFQPATKVSKTNTPPSITEGMLNPGQIMSDSLMVDIEGIHAGTVTRNYTRYTEQALRNSAPSWTTPYRRPLILHHNEHDGKTIGRICAAEYVNEGIRTKAGALKFTANVPDQNDQQEIRDGRLETVSIGTMVHDARCSICGQNIATEGWCEHERGQYYDGKLCVWDIYAMEAKELSYVIVPSDEFAGTLECYAPNKNPQGADKYMHYSQNHESLDQKGVKKPVETLTEQVDALKGEVSTLTEARDTAVAESATLQEKLKTAEESVASLTEAKATAETALTEAVAAKEEAEQAKVTAEAAAATEKQLREQLETEHEGLVAKTKECLVDAIKAVRLAAGKSALDEAKLNERSEDSLRDCLADLKEELEFKAPAAAPKGQEVKDPTLNDGKSADVKEKANEVLSINVKEKLSDALGLKLRK